MGARRAVQPRAAGDAATVQRPGQRAGIAAFDGEGDHGQPAGLVAAFTRRMMHGQTPGISRSRATSHPRNSR